MTLLSFLRRRVLGKSIPLIKRVVLPTAAVFFLLQIFSNTPTPQPQELSNLILPGEAIDPILKTKPGRIYDVNTKDHHKDVQDIPVAPRPSPVTQDHQTPLPVPPTGPVSSSGSTRNTRDDNDRSSSSNTGGKEEEKKAKPSSSWSMATANITDSHKVRFKGHAITNQTVTLTLMSSSDKVFMSLNKKEIYRNLGDRGLHLVVLNQHTGKVMARQVFDTFSTGVEEEMVEFIEDVRDGRILVFAVLDEASKNLSWRGRNKLKELGSRWADKLGYRDMWALVTRKGGLKMAETYSNVATADTGYEWGGPVFLRTDFDLEEEKGECEWPQNERNDVRRMFCQRYEGYGAMCECDVTNWSDVFFHADDKLHKQLAQTKLYKDLGVVILATERSHYLYKTLKALWEAPGLNRDHVAVYGDSFNREINAVAKLFGVQLVIEKALGNSSKEHIRHKVQRVFRDVVSAKFPSNTVPAGGLPEDTLPPFTCGHILLLEDDIQVSVDIFKFLHAVAPVLERDPMVLGISSFNYYGHRDVANSLTAVYRTDELNPMALLLPARTVHDHMAPSWPVANATSEWYHPLKSALAAVSGRALLYPEVPRARHTGYRGVMIEGGIQYNFFNDHILALTTDYEIPPAEILRLEVSQYEARLLETLKASEAITFDFCKHDLLYKENPLVMFVSYNGSRSSEAAMNYVMECLRTWSLYPEAGWKGVWQFHYHGHWLTIVAVPLSPYSYLKPAEYKVVTAPPTTTTTTSTTPTSSTSPSSSPNPSSAPPAT
ncbi:protein O-linked-mannose beta-1,2-N-acetylglucosaminyltransferase 1-like isoform X2 [Panulirus ornatus]